MLTLRLAAEQLRRANDLPGLEAIASLVGCDHAMPLTPEGVRALGLDGGITEVRVASGPGAIRALLIVRADDRPARDWLPRAAANLSRNAPHVLWLILATSAPGREVALAAFGSERRPPRISALIARRDAIMESDAETLRALASVAQGRDVLVHSRWVDILGRESLGARFYRGLQERVGGLAGSSRVGSSAVREELALLDASRLLFLCFLEAKGWLDGDRSFLASRFDACAQAGGGFRERVLRPLFFGTLNTPRSKRTRRALEFGSVPFLNGGLFSRTPEERIGASVAFSDDAYGALIFDLFAQYRFTSAEESSSWTEAAIDPEMLGRAFESLMAARDRRATGAFFTPFSLVERAASFAMERVFAESLDPTSLARVTLLDPACGSGAFLVHALERLANRLAELGDTRAVTTVRRDVLTRSIFGVDLNPTAVWLCQLRLWLSVVIDSDEADPERIAPLPNLDRNVRVGDSLAGVRDDAHRLARAPGALRLRQRYTRATGPRKRSLGRELDRLERRRAIAAIDAQLLSVSARRKDLVAARRGRDLFGDRYVASRDERLASEALRGRAADLRASRRRLEAGGALPFSFQTYFADVMGAGGFDIIVGNPPWVRPHHIGADTRATLRRDYEVARYASWDAGAAGAGAGAAFGAQVDLAALFVERSLALLGERGTLSLLVPAKLWRSLAGGGVRRLIADRAELRRVEDYSDAPATFDAAVYPSLVVIARSASVSTEHTCVDIAVYHRGHDAFAWQTPRRVLPLDESPGAPWVLLPPAPRAAFDLLRHAGTPLSQSAFGRPVLGVKCGCNDAFLVDVIDASDDRTRVRTSDGQVREIERDMIRPLLRGDALRRWSPSVGTSAILWTHDASGAPLATLPPLAAKWLRRWRRALVARTDAARAGRWWSLFRIDGARDDRPRVVWGDVGREPRASVIVAGDPTVMLNSCYSARCPGVDDADALCALLNSPVARAWLDAIAEPARGGYRRYLGWTLALLPIPHDWPRARALLAPLGADARFGRPPGEQQLLDIAAAAYDVDRRDAAPLVAWMAR